MTLLLLDLSNTVAMHASFWEMGVLLVYASYTL